MATEFLFARLYWVEVERRSQTQEFLFARFCRVEVELRRREEEFLFARLRWVEVELRNLAEDLFIFSLGSFRSDLLKIPYLERGSFGRASVSGIGLCMALDAGRPNAE